MFRHQVTLLERKKETAVQKLQELRWVSGLEGPLLESPFYSTGNRKLKLKKIVRGGVVLTFDCAHFSISEMDYT